MTTRIIEEIRAIRQELYEEEKRLGRDEFVRRQRERVEKFLEGTLAKFVPPAEAPRLLNVGASRAPVQRFLIRDTLKRR